MGLLKRLRAASSGRKPPESSPTASPSPNTTTSTVDSNASSNHPRVLRRSPSANLLGVPNDFPGAMPRVSTSSTVASTSSSPNSARGSMLPWKKDKRKSGDELQSIPYEATSASPLRGSLPLNQSVPTIATSSPPTTQPSRPPRSTSHSYNTQSTASEPPSPHSPTKQSAYHTRTASHESQRTVISLNSTFTGRSRRTSTSTEWRQEGGVLGKFAFESGDWGELTPGTPLQSPPPSAGPSKHTTPGTSPTKRSAQSPLLALSPTPKSRQKEASPSAKLNMRKLGASHTSPSLPSVSTFSSNPLGAHASEEWPQQQRPAANEKADVMMMKGKGKTRETGVHPKGKGDVTNMEAKAQSPPEGLVKDKEEVEEIFTSTSEPDLDEKRRFWKPGMRTRRTSKTRAPEERPVSMSHVESRPPLRRPPSSLFHNPFGRTQSRVSLAFELDQQTQGDDGSFQLKSFRHISGASDAEGGFSQYLSLTSANDVRAQRDNEQDRSTSGSTIVPRKPSSGATSPMMPASPSALPRPRPPSAAGSDSSQRVSVAAFRKGVRRPSSSVLVDDDDDIPLSLNRANLGESGLRRDSNSALSLTDGPSPSRPKRSLPPTPVDEARSKGTIGSIGLGLPPPIRASNPPSPALGGGFVVKGPRANIDAKDAKTMANERLPSPAPIPDVSVTASPKVTRPPRASSLSNAADDALGVSSPPILSSPDGPVSTRAQSQSPPLPTPAPLRIPQPQANVEDILLKLPPRPDELPDEPTPRESPNRGATLSPTFSLAFDEPLRRISGLWSGGTPDPSDDKEEAFDSSLVESTLRDNSHRGGSADAASENRQSLYNRLAAATSSAISTASSALPTASTEERLYIPPPRTPSPPPLQAQSPTSERTASPIPIPPPMAEPPAPPPALPHSSFGRVPRRPAEKPRGARADKKGWASSSDEDDDEKPLARPATSVSTATTRAIVESKAEPARARPQSAALLSRPHSSAALMNGVEVLSDSEEDEPLNVLKASRSRDDLRSMLPRNLPSQPSSQNLKRDAAVPARTNAVKPVANGHAMPQANGQRPRTASTPAAGVTPSASKWSLSSSPNDSPDSDDMSPPVRPTSRPTSRHSARPGSRVSIARDLSAEQIHSVPARTGSADTSRDRSSMVIPRNQSSDRLRASSNSATKMHQPSPRRSPMAMVAASDSRPTASPASSQSGLTGDSSGQLPMTPRSAADPSRRSWADGRPRPDAETASARARPATHFDQWGGAAAGASNAQFPYAPGMDPYGGQSAAYKQQIQAQWMAAAQRHFEDMWERASSVSNAQTAPHGPHSGGMFQPTYGYSYSQPPPMPPMPQMPQMPQMPYGGYPYPYGGFGGPQVAFPGGMPMAGMPGMPGMPMQGMPPMGGPSAGYGYGPGAQSVYGGEFGPPVAPAMRETVPGSPGGSPSRQRARRSSGQTDIGSARPASVAHNVGSSSASVIGVPASQYSQQRSTPPRRAPRRTSGLAMSEVGGPPSSWRASMGDDLETPRPKRVANAS